MKYTALNVGRRESGFSADELERLANDTGAPLISSNLRPTRIQRFLPRRVRIERGGRPITIIGLLSARAAVGEHLRIEDPRYALETELMLLEGKPDFVILLSALDAKETERVLDGLEGVDLIVGGAVPRGTEKLESLAGVPCFLVQGKGQYVGRVDFEVRDERLVPVSGRRIWLGPDVASDPDTDRRIRLFQRSLEGLDLLGKRERREDDSPFLGSTNCAACHAGEYESWKATRHADALASLTPEKGRFDPECLTCHTVGTGEHGYVDEKRTPQFAAVGCESCHGPSRAHAEAPLLARRPKTPGNARDCAACHDADHSNPFDLKTRIAAIRHWPDADAAKGRKR
jgi:hypothetical protein